MSVLTHYIVVRRDLPFGVLLAQVAHAAGESFYAYAVCPSSSVKERAAFNGEVGGLSPPWGSIQPDQAVVVVLGARNEAKLRRLARQLTEKQIPHVAIREPAYPYCGAMMSVGLLPGIKDALSAHVNEFQLFREQ